MRALNGVSLSLQPGEVLAVVGESGCGKTTLALSILRLLPFPGEITSGEIVFDGRDVMAMSEEELRRLRGRSISMIFQDPVSGLNPVLPIGKQVEEILSSHLDIPKRERRQRAIDLLRQVGLTGARASCESVSFPPIRRHVPARHDRHGHGAQSASADRGRADLGPRRYRPSADSLSSSRLCDESATPPFFLSPMISESLPRWRIRS